MGSLDALDSPEVSLMQVSALRVSSHQALGDPGIVQALSVAESAVAISGTQQEAKSDPANRALEVHIGLVRARL